MSPKTQLDAYRREYEANAAPQVVAAVRRSIKALAETDLVATAVKAGEIAPGSGCAGAVASSTFRTFSNEVPLS